MIFRSPHPSVSIPDVPVTSAVFQHADTFAEKLALIDTASGDSVTYGELTESIRRVAKGLALVGMRKGDVLATLLPNTMEYAIVFHAVAAMGGIVMPINPQSTPEEIVHRFRDARVAFLIAVSETLGLARAVIRQSPVRELIVIGQGSGETSFSTLLASDGESWPAASIEPTQDVVTLLYSSGTSGVVKGVMLTHRNLVSALHQFGVSDAIEPDDVVLGVLPFFHQYGQSVLNGVLARGGTLVLLPRFDMSQFLRAIQDYAVTRAYLVPPILVRLAKEQALEDYDLSSLRLLQSGGAPISAAIARQCASRLGCVVSQGYALTECYPAIRMGLLDPEMEKVGSVGRCAPNTECKIVSPATGQELGSGEAGEIWLRGPQVMRGYLNQADATAQVIDDGGWLRTGDLAVVDDDGFVTIVDRLKELIKYMGYQVAPAELEALLLLHPAVRDVAVVGSPDEEAGEIPKALVVTNGDVTKEELIAFVAQRVATYKKVRCIEFVEAIPKSPSGKILRRLLTAQELALHSLAVGV